MIALLNLLFPVTIANIRSVAYEQGREDEREVSRLVIKGLSLLHKNQNE